MLRRILQIAIVIGLLAVLGFIILMSVLSVMSWTAPDNLGVKDGKLPFDAFGRFAQLPTGHKNPDFIGAFKTPPLRALSSTWPFMHTGEEKSLEAVVDFYDRRFDMKLTDEEKEDLINFLEVL